MTTTQPFVRSYASVEGMDRVHPCFHQNQYWNGWAMPYFEFDVAVKLAEATQGVYNKDTDSFIYDDNGEKDEYTAEMITVDGKEVKVYGIGAGYWCWEHTDDLKVYEGFWSGEAFYSPGKRFVDEYFFCDENGYDEEEIRDIHALPIGGEWESPDYGHYHTVTRIK